MPSSCQNISYDKDTINFLRNEQHHYNLLAQYEKYAPKRC
ncbi:hypothetical protein THOM_1980 [Trachipleistophora hominis]|uniref:Uncharacterized protein n=1 Tax=Trachipleistophora hominis TaxID=72359 RepID=L7JUI5_TRAHO|nr:hypothetical protein THOM_1980 [Trachipleistophora hominis]